MKLHNPFSDDNNVPDSVSAFAILILVIVILVLIQLPGIKVFLFLSIIVGVFYMFGRVLYFIFTGK